jgi:hypothetical protein
MRDPTLTEILGKIKGLLESFNVWVDVNFVQIFLWTIKLSLAATVIWIFVLTVHYVITNLIFPTEECREKRKKEKADHQYLCRLLREAEMEAIVRKRQSRN